MSEKLGWREAMRHRRAMHRYDDRQRRGDLLVRTCANCGLKLKAGRTFYCSTECKEQVSTVGTSRPHNKPFGMAKPRNIFVYRKTPPITLKQYSIQKDEEDMELYNLKRTPTPGWFIMTKFDKNLEVESSYLMSYDTCPCPRGQVHSNCRHRTMLPIFKQHKHIDDGWFLDYHTRQWHPPVDLEPHAPEAQERVSAPLPTEPAAPVETPPAVVSGAPKSRVLGLRGL